LYRKNSEKVLTKGEKSKKKQKTKKKTKNKKPKKNNKTKKTQKRLENLKHCIFNCTIIFHVVPTTVTHQQAPQHSTSVPSPTDPLTYPLQPFTSPLTPSHIHSHSPPDPVRSMYLYESTKLCAKKSEEVLMKELFFCT